MAKRTITKDEYIAAREGYMTLKVTRRGVARIDTDVAREMLDLIDKRMVEFRNVIRLWQTGIKAIESVTIETED